MRKYRYFVSLALGLALLVQIGVAQNPEINRNPLPRHFPTNERFKREFIGRGGGGSSLAYHNGPVMGTAHVVPIYWGWNTSDPIATSLTNYIAAFGTTGEYNVITQYYQTGPLYISLSNLGGSAIYDNTALPNNGAVGDTDVQAAVLRATKNNPQADTVYEVFLPSGTYSYSGSYTSCGGPNLYYCAYHGNFNYNGSDVKYASMPYPSCGGCQTSGFNVTQNFEHFISHETREAVTDPDGNAWYDRRGYEADDKCAWSPTPFKDSSTGTNTDGSAFAYQYEWSNANGGCVKTQ